MKKAVITGSTGSVGRAIIDKLVSENVEVTVLYHRGSKRIDGIPSNELVKKICCSLDEMKDFVPEKTIMRFSTTLHGRVQRVQQGSTPTSS